MRCCLKVLFLYYSTCKSNFLFRIYLKLPEFIKLFFKNQLTFSYDITFKNSEQGRKKGLFHNVVHCETVPVSGGFQNIVSMSFSHPGGE